jgi:hypothetical protein
MRTITRNHPVTRKPVSHQIPSGFDKVYKDLMDYNGTFSFILSMRSTMLKYGKLTDKQWTSVAKCLAPKPVEDPTVVAVASCDIPITISPTSARYIAKVNKWGFNPQTLTVTQIKSQNKSGYHVRAKIDWTSSVSVCRCCGKSLTDWRSQATGVGPVCVKGTGITYVRNQSDIARFQQEMQDLCSKIGEVEVFIKKWHIRQGSESLDKAIQSSSPVKIEVEPPKVVLPLQYFDWDVNSKTLTCSFQKLAQYINQSALPDTLSLHNSVTDMSVTFIRRAGARIDGSALYVSTDPNHPISMSLL